MTAISEFRRALGEIQAPALSVLRPGLSPDQIKGAVASTCPSLSPYVDSVIEEWWSWHDGIDQERCVELNFHARRIYTPEAISPECMRLYSLSALLELTYVYFEPDFLDGRPIFPIGTDDGGKLYVLRKMRYEGPWEVWELPKSGEAWVPLRQLGDPGTAPLFDQWLGELVRGIGDGRINVSEFGGIGRPGIEPDSDENFYPYP